MKYNQPFGVTDQNAGYQNGNPAIGLKGSIIPAEAMEQTQRELVSLITKAGFTPSAGDLMQALKAIRSHRLNYVLDASDTAGDIVVNPDPSLDAYTLGLELNVQVAHDCPGASRINVSGLGFVAVVRSNGSATQEDDYDAGSIVSLVFDGNAFEIKNYRGHDTDITNVNNNYFKSIPFVLDTGAVNAVVANFDPAITAPVKGDIIEVEIAYANTAAVTIAVNALAAVPMTRWDGTALQQNDVRAGENLLLSFEGTYWQLINPVPSAYAGFFKIPYAKDTGPVNQLQATYNPSVGALLYDGLAVLTKAGHAPTAAITFSPNGLTPKPVQWPNGTAVGAAAFGTNAILFLVYDADNQIWQLLSVISPPSSNFPYFPNIGSYCLAIPNPRGYPFTDILSSPVMPGQTVPGASLIIYSANVSGPSGQAQEGSQLPGTWMCVGGYFTCNNVDPNMGTYLSNGQLLQFAMYQRVA